MKLNDLKKIGVEKIKFVLPLVSDWCVALSVEDSIRLSKHIDNLEVSYFKDVIPYFNSTLDFDISSKDMIDLVKLKDLGFDIYFVYNTGLEVKQLIKEDESIIIKPEYYGYIIKHYKYSISKDSKGQPIWSNRISSNPDSAYLMALEEKYLGHNHKWAEYQLKQLNINW